jgi:dolichol-phosphate mannosyltransferase
VTPPLDVSFVVPCHDEAGNLRALVAGIHAAAGGLGVAYEIVITDDASDDSSWAVLRELAAHDPRLRAQRFARNCGESAASWAGMLASRGRIIVTLDADLQNDPAEIPRFLAALDDADCVCGTRVEARRSGDDWLRVLSSRIANGVRVRLAGGDISDAGCTYRAFRRECLANIRFFKGIHRFLPTLIAMEGFRVCEIPVRNQPRVSGRSHYGVRNRVFVALADLLAIRWMKSRAVRYEIAESTDWAQEERRGSP